MSLAAGSLVKRISIQALTANSPSQDPGGVPDEDWVTEFSPLAAIEPLRGRELLAAQQISSEVTGTIKIRYRADKQVTAKHRVLYGTRVFDIVAVIDPEERHEELVLYVREGANTDG